MRKISEKNLGKKGEDLAVAFLQEKCNYKILERNYRFGKEEIDIIAFDDNTLVFIEVKTRKNEVFENPINAINSKKIDKIKKVADYFLFQKGFSDIECRFDAVLIIENSSDKIRLLKDAFR